MRVCMRAHVRVRVHVLLPAAFFRASRPPRDRHYATAQFCGDVAMASPCWPSRPWPPAHPCYQSCAHAPAPSRLPLLRADVATAHPCAHATAHTAPVQCLQSARHSSEGSQQHLRCRSCRRRPYCKAYCRAVARSPPAQQPQWRRGPTPTQAARAPHAPRLGCRADQLPAPTGCEPGRLRRRAQCPEAAETGSAPWLRHRRRRRRCCRCSSSVCAGACVQAGSAQGAQNDRWRRPCPAAPDIQLSRGRRADLAAQSPQPSGIQPCMQPCAG
eukprot:366273-Chlamydomonas_euryale.AAC.8